MKKVFFTLVAVMMCICMMTMSIFASEIDTSKNGVVRDEDGEIRYYVDGEATYAGVVQDAEGNYYYINSSRKAVKSTTRTIRSDMTNGLLSPHYTYTFDENGVITNPVPLNAKPTPVKNGIVKDEDGYIRYYVNGKATAPGVVKDAEGNFYFFGSSKYATTNNTRKIDEARTNGLIVAGTYTFDADGKITAPIIPTPVEPDTKPEVLNGLVGDHYYVDGKKVGSYYGLIEHEGNFYYIADDAKIVKGCRKYVSTTNELYFPDGTQVPSRYFEFDADGKMIYTIEFDSSKNGLAFDQYGVLRYYKDGKPIFAGYVYDDNGNLYYVDRALKAWRVINLR